MHPFGPCHPSIAVNMTDGWLWPIKRSMDRIEQGPESSSIFVAFAKSHVSKWVNEQIQCPFTNPGTRIANSSGKLPKALRRTRHTQRKSEQSIATMIAVITPSHKQREEGTGVDQKFLILLLELVFHNHDRITGIPGY